MDYRQLFINKDRVVMASVDLAVIIGDCEEAIVLNQVSYWLERFKDTNHNFKDGRYWVYNSYQKWHDDNFPFWHPSKIQRIFRSLENKGLLLSANYNDVGFDKTKWYSINYDKLQEMADDYKRPLINSEQSSIENEQPPTASDYSMSRFKRPLINSEQSSIENEQPSIASDYPIPEDTTKDTTEDTTKDICMNEYILSGTPDDTPDSPPEDTTKKSKKKKTKTHPEEVRQIIDYFNQACGTNYKYQSKATADMVNARLNDGFTVQDFYTVIDKKHAEWSNDSYWCKYLRPETLFRPAHFESYLNQRSDPAEESANGISREMSELYNALIIE